MGKDIKSAEKNEPKKRLSVLEQYYRLGWLSKARHKWSAEDRLKAGQRLYGDFYRSHRLSGCIDYEKPRVDSSLKTAESVAAAEAHTRFSAAFKAIPVEFRGVVYSVCCDDKVLPEPQGMGGRRKIAHKTEQAVLLCLGLDKLIWHYIGGSTRIGKIKKIHNH